MSDHTPFDIPDNLFGHLLDYQHTDEFKRDAEQQAQKTRDMWAKQTRLHHERYPNARRLRAEAQQHKATLYDRQQGLCRWCNQPLGTRYEIDHIKPISKGGTSELRSLCVCHKRCNSMKGAGTMEQQTLW